MTLLDASVEAYAILNETRNRLMVIYNFVEDLPENKRRKIEKAIKSIEEALKQLSK